MRVLHQIFKISDLRKKVLFVLFMLFLYKIGSHVPVPGVNSAALSSLTSQGGLLGFADALSGGALKRFSIFAVGIMPYITSSIIIQLLAMDVIPILAEWSRQGEDGQKKTKKLTRYMTVIIAFLQSFAMSFGFNSLYPGLVSNPSIPKFLMMAGVLTLGTIILMVMAELIDKKGIGKGMSLIIFAGILMVIPDTIYMYGVSEFTSANHQLFIPIVKSIILVIFVVGVILFILYMEGSTRKIPIQYHRGTQADGKMPQAYKSYIPMKINSAGVIPVIFAVSLVMTPTSIAQFFPNSSVALFITKYFSLTNPVGVVFYSLLIIAFTYFYAFVQINPEKMADNLKKSGGYIPGIRPGRDTQNYFSKVLGRLTFSGAIYLTLIAILPIIITDLAGLPQQVRIGGTSLIILISVALDTVAQIESQLTQRSYRGFLKK